MLLDIEEMLSPQRWRRHDDDDAGGDAACRITTMFTRLLSRFIRKLGTSNVIKLVFVYFYEILQKAADAIL